MVCDLHDLEITHHTWGHTGRSPEGERRTEGSREGQGERGRGEREKESELAGSAYGGGLSFPEFTLYW